MKLLIQTVLFSDYAFMLVLIVSFSLFDYEVKMYPFLIVCLVCFLFAWFVTFLIAVFLVSYSLKYAILGI